MQKKLCSMGLFVGLVLGAGSASADPMLLGDHYVGSDDHGYGDVIGEANKFNISGMTVNLVGSVLTVDVHTLFANAGLGTFGNYTQGNKGIGFGDLFLAASWDPFDNGTTSTEANGYLGDNYLTGTNWDYGFSLVDRWSSVGGNGTWYNLTGDGQNGAILRSEQFMTGAIYRNGQEIAVNTASPDASALMDGTWSVNDAANKVSFSFDIAGTTLAASDTIALHWSMTCGNDTIEAVFNKPVSAPEPASLALFMLSLLGLFGLRRRSSQSEAA